MAKKTKKQVKKARVNELPENMLPQNILPVGERVEENKNIYISQAVYKEIHNFTKNKTTNESGGMLVGTVIEEFGKTNIVISGFVEAKYCEATPTTLKFTHETWDFVHKEIEKKYKGKKIVGWIHTHPDFGIFLSEYDKFIHQNFFSEAYQVAYVVDPIQNTEGFYFWINGNIEKCKGFYIYDKTGTQITVDAGKAEADEEKRPDLLFSMKNVLTAILSVAVIFLIFANISVNKQLKALEREQEKLETQQVTLTSSANQALMQLQQLIVDQDAQIEELRGILKETGVAVEPEDTFTETENTEQGTTDTTTDVTTDETTSEETTEDESTEATESTENVEPTEVTEPTETIEPTEATEGSTIADE